MCYNIESSIKTTLLSFFSIIYLLLSGIPHFQWLGVTLIGWCGMQFAELLLWYTEPRKGCTEMNKIITLTLVPLFLLLQPLGILFGSLFVIPWNKSTDFRKYFIIFYSLLVICLVFIFHLYKPYKICTIVTKQGHLDWNTRFSQDGYLLEEKGEKTNFNKYYINPIISYFAWLITIAIPLFIFWNKNFLIIIILFLLPLFGFFYGLMYTDSKGSIWCYYTSYSSVICAFLLFLKQTKIYSII
jgi:hypothetical protein